MSVILVCYLSLALWPRGPVASVLVLSQKEMHQPLCSLSNLLSHLDTVFPPASLLLFGLPAGAVLEAVAGLQDSDLQDLTSEVLKLVWAYTKFKKRRKSCY